MKTPAWLLSLILTLAATALAQDPAPAPAEKSKQEVPPPPASGEPKEVPKPPSVPPPPAAKQEVPKPPQVPPPPAPGEPKEVPKPPSVPPPPAAKQEVPKPPQVPPPPAPGEPKEVPKPPSVPPPPAAKQEVPKPPQVPPPPAPGEPKEVPKPASVPPPPPAKQEVPKPVLPPPPAVEHPKPAASSPQPPPAPPKTEARQPEPESPKTAVPKPGSSAQEPSIPDSVPLPDRWQIPFSYYPLNEPGSLIDPYHQNILKGDYPIIGQNIFLSLTGRSDTTFEARRLPTPSNVSTEQARNPDFFGGGDQLFLNQDFAATVEVYRGETAFRPRDWEIRATAALNYNYVDVRENSILNPSPDTGTTRGDKHAALQEFLAELHLVDVSPNYDFVAVRAGIQPFVSDFRGFIFKDTNLGVRLFGTFLSNRIQWNLAGFEQLEKDTNSNLNTFHSRDQRIYVANVYVQDFIWEGYTAQLSFHNSRDDGDVHYDNNDFLVRPAKIGTIQKHEVNPFYFGWAGDGHIGGLNVSHALYLARGNDDFNQLAGRQVDIAGTFAAVELSYDIDWIRLRGSFLWSSGDKDPSDGRATGFDTIFDNPFWAGGPFSFWNRQSLALQGVNLVNRDSLVPDLRSSKTQGQINFVNPGLFLYNVGLDADVLPEMKAIFNASLMKFQDTSSLETFTQQGDIRRDLGVDVSLGLVVRPGLTNNVILTLGASGFFPGGGFKDLYETRDALYSTFVELSLTY